MAQLSRAISSQLRHVSTIGKNLLSSNMFSTCSHNMMYFGPLSAEIGPVVWGTPANFNWLFFCYCSLLCTKLSPCFHFPAKRSARNARNASTLRCVRLKKGPNYQLLSARMYYLSYRTRSQRQDQCSECKDCLEGTRGCLLHKNIRTTGCANIVAAG